MRALPPRLRPRRALLAAGLALALAGCAPGFVLPSSDLQFDLTGRLAVRYRGEGATGNLAWRHSERTDEMLLTSPVGQGLARLVRQDAEVVLTLQDGREMRAADAEALTEQALGFRIPMAGLAEWVRGRVAPAPPPVREVRDGRDRLIELEQAGWTIHFQEYDGRIPLRLQLTYPGVELRLAITEWK